MEDGKVRRNAQIAQSRQHHRRPTVVGLPRDRVDGLAGIEGIRVAVDAGIGHHPDFNRRIHCSDQCYIPCGPHSIGVGIMGEIIIVDFIPLVEFVAHLPILETQGRGMGDAEKVLAVIIGQRRRGAQGGPMPRRLPVKPIFIHAQRQRVVRAAVTIGHPGGGLIGSAGAVVERDHGLRIDVGHHMNEIGQGHNLLPSILVIIHEAGQPVVIVGPGAARKSQSRRAHVGQQS